MDRFAATPERDNRGTSGAAIGVTSGAANGAIPTDELIGAVRELIGLMGKGHIAELDLTSGDMTIRLRGTTQLASGAVSVVSATETVPALPPSDPGYVVTAPMIGTWYNAPSPGDDPFVRIGDEVEVGQVVGIIEAMKIMNEIVADRAGVVSDILVENAQAVEYGSPLVRLTDQTDAIM